MSLASLIIFIVVTVGLQQANSQSTGYQNQNYNEQANQGRRNANQNNQHQNNRDHCLMTNIKLHCTPGPGRRIYNSGNVWDPSQQQDGGADENWNCTHCCQVGGKTIPMCDSNMGNPSQNNNQQVNQNRIQQVTQRRSQNRNQQVIQRRSQNGNNDQRQNRNQQVIQGRSQNGNQANSQRTGYQNQNNNQRANQGRRNGNQNNQQQNNRDHCLMTNTKHDCTPGLGRRIYNTGNVWDPNLEQDGGVDENWNCTPCCQFGGKTIPKCQNQNRNQRVIQGRSRNGNRNNQNQGMGQIRRMKRGIEEEKEETKHESTELPPTILTENITTPESIGGESDHCQHHNVTFRCSSGPGRRIYNSCDEWDPACEEDGGEDPHWNCIACCLEKGKSLPACEENMERAN